MSETPRSENIQQPTSIEEDVQFLGDAEPLMTPREPSELDRDVPAVEEPTASYKDVSLTLAKAQLAIIGLGIAASYVKGPMGSKPSG